MAILEEKTTVAFNIRRKIHGKHLTKGRTDCSAVAAHAHTSLHDITWVNFSILHTEHDFNKRKIAET